jgi:hypothetical protein
MFRLPARVKGRVPIVGPNNGTTQANPVKPQARGTHSSCEQVLNCVAHALGNYGIRNKLLLISMSVISRELERLSIVSMIQPQVNVVPPTRTTELGT